ncbi:MAG: hypothetical protein LBL09_00650 [Oscillospiraceae bacterium]|jgi:hypothetical protein|nr:hypothetical protein [Oscillospiraceae bacterium]
MALIYACPFYKYELVEKRRVFCEGGRLDFASAKARREYVYVLCADEYRWGQCSIAKNLLRQYDGQLSVDS